MESMEVLLFEEKQFLNDSLENVNTLENNISQKWTKLWLFEVWVILARFHPENLQTAATDAFEG